MFELNGKYGSVKVFTDLVDQSAISQIIGMLNQPFAENAHVRIMPDVCPGVGCTIGTTMKITDKVCPNIVGVDLFCGMFVVQLAEKDIDYEKLDAVIRRYIPAGRNLRQKYHPNVDKLQFEELTHGCYHSINIDQAKLSIGTLGGGNHFIEVARSEYTGILYLVIHTGSRHLGTQVAKYYQRIAIKECCGLPKEDIARVVEDLKAQGRQSEIEATLKQMKQDYVSVPEPLAYLSGESMDNYMSDLRFMRKFARWNRKTIADEILLHAGLTSVDSFETIHNYIDVDTKMLRKGAVSAQEGETLIIPMNMRDGSLICVGKGSPDWNCSAPHGAGRLMSRGQAKDTISLDEFRESMADVYSTSGGQGTIDESPMAYKPMESIIENIGDTVEVLEVIKPEYNFKAGEDDERETETEAE